MGDNIVKLNVQPQWLASFDLVRRTDGTHALVLIDARKSFIEDGQDDVAARLRHIASLAEEGASTLFSEAGKIG